MVPPRFFLIIGITCFTAGTAIFLHKTSPKQESPSPMTPEQVHAMLNPPHPVWPKGSEQAESPTTLFSGDIYDIDKAGSGSCTAGGGKTNRPVNDLNPATYVFAIASSCDDTFKMGIWHNERLIKVQVQAFDRTGQLLNYSPELADVKKAFPNCTAANCLPGSATLVAKPNVWQLQGDSLAPSSGCLDLKAYD